MCLPQSLCINYSTVKSTLTTHTHTGRHIYKLVQVILYIIVGLFRSKDEYQKFHMAQPRIFNRWGTEEVFEGKVMFHFVINTLFSTPLHN